MKIFHNLMKFHNNNNDQLVLFKNMINGTVRMCLLYDCLQTLNIKIELSIKRNYQDSFLDIEPSKRHMSDLKILKRS